MFVALRTEKRDGHNYLAAAAARGAAAALVARVVPDSPLPQLVVADPLAALHALARAHRARFRGTVVGVTGSAGKTSTKDLLAVLLGATSQVLATEGNLNNHLGVPLTLLRLDPAQHRHAVVEAGISGPGEMDVIAAMIAPVKPFTFNPGRIRPANIKTSAATMIARIAPIHPPPKVIPSAARSHAATPAIIAIRAAAMMAGTKPATSSPIFNRLTTKSTTAAAMR
jgi:hypothetical protein